MKKVLAITMAALLIVMLLAGCGTNEPSNQADNNANTEDAATNTPEADNVESEPEETPEQEQEDVTYEVTYKNVMVYTSSIGSTWAQAIVEVTNTGTKDLYLSSASFDLEDASGALVSVLKMVSVCPDVISPGEKAYYYDASTLENVESEVELTIVPHLNVKEAKVDRIRFPVSEDSLSMDQFDDITLIGRVENNTEETQSMVYVAVILYNSNDAPIGHLTTILMEDLAPGDKIGFECSAWSLPDSVTLDSIAWYEVIAYPTQFQF